MLVGQVRDSEPVIRSCLEQQTFFVPEQVLLPSLHRRHWTDHGEDGPCDLDHAFHELVALRDAREDEVQTLQSWGQLNRLVALFAKPGSE